MWTGPDVVLSTAEALQPLTARAFPDHRLIKDALWKGRNVSQLLSAGRVTRRVRHHPLDLHGDSGQLCIRSPSLLRDSDYVHMPRYLTIALPSVTMR